ncbi:hypothetical protein H257_06608 [Aphanomyces astaci]|uniref:Uncharacterized protein n=1 Tax=Aphanomyces astaci TaxID=112090 RepID=W4GMZ1_APHAT|nr:hypothetical protein H257_06608 [Aphanomyces astaci]ETV80268.1 hypothetical protein H257_06608 [Aphanomyces astaci]|eukprot:XP_009830192.1 hypothetical protein H257_06608 [Aphanomyces astaci]
MRPHERDGSVHVAQVATSVLDFFVVVGRRFEDKRHGQHQDLGAFLGGREHPLHRRVSLEEAMEELVLEQHDARLVVAFHFVGRGFADIPPCLGAFFGICLVQHWKQRNVCGQVVVHVVGACHAMKEEWCRGVLVV